MIPWPRPSGSTARGFPAMAVVAFAALVAVGVAACQAGTALPPLPPAAALAVPDLRGTWVGTWNGVLLTLAILEQDVREHGGGVSVGSWPVLGGPRPGVTGIATVAASTAGPTTPTSMHVQGWFAAGPALRIEIRNPYGPQELVLKIERDRLVGTGTSNFRWGPTGPVELRRTTGPPPA